jgi:uncharacterized protein YciI
MLEDNLKTYSKVITENPHKMNKNTKTKQKHRKYLNTYKKREHCLNQAEEN